MPRKHKITKTHKRQKINKLILVKFSALVAKYYFSEWTQGFRFVKVFQLFIVSHFRICEICFLF